MNIRYGAFDLVYFGFGHGVQRTPSSVSKSLAHQKSVLRMCEALPDTNPAAGWCVGQG